MAIWLSIQTLGVNTFLSSKISHLTLPIRRKQVGQATPEINLPRLRLQDIIEPLSESNLTISYSIQTLGINIFLSSKISHLTFPIRRKQVSQATPEINLSRMRLQDIIVPLSDSNLTNSYSIQTLGIHFFLSSNISNLTLLIRPKQVLLHLKYHSLTVRTDYVNIQHFYGSLDVSLLCSSNLV